MNFIKISQFLIGILVAFPALSMENSDYNVVTNNQGQLVIIRNKIKDYSATEWKALLQHIQQPNVTKDGQVSGFHSYRSLKHVSCNGNYSNPTIHTIAPNLWVATTGNNNSYHTGYLICRLADGSFYSSKLKKSFFPCWLSTQAIINLIASNIDTASVEPVYQDDHKCVTEVIFNHGKTEIKLIATLDNGKFFINTVYPNVPESQVINKEEQSDLLLCQKEIDRQYPMQAIAPTISMSTAQENNIQKLFDTQRFTEIEEQLKKGMDPDFCIQNKPLLLLACENNYYPLITLLLNYGANVNQKFNGTSIIERTLDNPNPLILATLLEMVPDQINKEELLLKAIQKLNLTAIKILISQYVDVNTQDNNGNTPLHYCVLAATDDKEIQHIDANTHIPRTQVIGQITKCLLCAGADFSIENNKKQTVLKLLETQQHTRWQKIDAEIHEYNQQKNVFEQIKQEEFKEHPDLIELMWLVQTNNTKKIEELLPQTKERYYVGKALEFAKGQGHPKVIRLLQHRANELEQLHEANYNNRVSNINSQQNKELELQQKYYTLLDEDNLSSLTDQELKEFENLSGKRISLLCTAAENNKTKSINHLLNRDYSQIGEPYSATDLRNALQVAYDNKHNDLLISLIDLTLTSKNLSTQAQAEILYPLVSCIPTTEKDLLHTIITHSSPIIAQILAVALKDENSFVSLLNIVKQHLNNDTNFVQLLNYPVNKQRTLLILACKLGKTEAVKELLQYPVVLSSKDQKEHDALYYAKQINPEIEKLLFQEIDKRNNRINNNITPATSSSTTSQITDLNERKEQPAQKTRKASKPSIQKTLNLIELTKQANFVLVKKAIEQGVDINATDKKGNTALYYAAQLGYLEILKHLLANKADHLRKCENDNTALMAAAIKENDDCILALIKHDSSKEHLSVINTKKQHILLLIVSQGKTDIVKTFCTLPNLAIPQTEFTGLIHHAAQNGHLETTKYFLSRIDKSIEEDPDVEIRGLDWPTALGNAMCLSAEKGHLEIVKLLLNFGIPIHFQSPQTAKNIFDYAHRGKQNNIIKFIQKYMGYHKELIKQIIENKPISLNKDYFNPNHKNEDSNSLLHIATEAFNDRAVNLLLEKGADANERLEHRRTLLMKVLHSQAPIETSLKMAQSLLKYKANVNDYDKDGETALTLCTEFLEKDKLSKVITLLLENGANVNHQNYDKTTALMYCIQRKLPDCVELLLKHNANPNLKDVFGKTALMQAILIKDNSKLLEAENLQKIIDLLQNHASKHSASKSQNSIPTENLNTNNLDNLPSNPTEEEQLIKAIETEQFARAFNIIVYHKRSKNDNNDSLFNIAIKSSNVCNKTPNDQSQKDAVMNKWDMFLNEFFNSLSDSNLKKITLSMYSDAQLGEIQKLAVKFNKKEAVIILMQQRIKQQQKEKTTIQNDSKSEITDMRDAAEETVSSKNNSKLDIQKTISDMLHNGIINDDPKLIQEAHKLSVDKLKYSFLTTVFHNPNYPKDIGSTPLIIAIDRNKTKATIAMLTILKSIMNTQYLTDFINLKNDNGDSALLLAAKRNNTELIKLLCGYKCNLDIQSESQNTALHYLTMHQNNSAVLTLLQNGANPDIKGDKEVSPLEIAALKNYSDIVNTLLKHNASPNYNNPLFLAIKAGNNSIINTLITHNADVNREGRENMFPLQLAVRENNIEAVKALLNAGANNEDAMCNAKLIAESYNFNEILELLNAHTASEKKA